MNDSLSQKYGPFFVEGVKLRIDAGESGESQLQALSVPKELAPLLPYAEFWGIADDTYRIELIKRSPPELWTDFQNAVSKKKTALLDWLSGPEADKLPSPEYLAFSFMLQAFDWPRP